MTDPFAAPPPRDPDGPPAYGAPPQFGAPQYGAPGYGPPPYGGPGYGQPPFGTPGYGQPPYGYGQPRGGTNGLAIASLVTGILGFFFVTPILAIIFGVIGRKQAWQRGQSGSGLATAGIILGTLWVIFWVFAIVHGNGHTCVGTGNYCSTNDNISNN